MLMKNVLRWSALALAAGTTVQAVVIDGYSSSTHDRFTGTFPSAPAPNASAGFIGAAYDWSGVGWDAGTPTRNIALIDDEYFVFSTHYAPGASLKFFSPTLYAANPGNPAAAVVSYTWNPVDRIAFKYPGATETGDFSVGRLSSAIDPAHGLATYPILNLPTLNAYVGLSLFVYGFSSSTTSPRIGQNQIDGFATYDMYPLNVGNSVSDTFWAAHEDNDQPDNALVQVGDSSGPLFTSYLGSLALIGTHSAVGMWNGTPANFDNFIPVYLQAMADASVQFTTVPEVPAVMGSVVLALAALGYRRRLGQK